jgi:hypothetical protein
MTTTIPPDGAPAIPPRVRTVAYFIGLAVGAGAILAGGIAAAVSPGSAVNVLAICGTFTAATSFVLGSLGVAFRPTAGLPNSSNTWGDGTPVATTPVIGDRPISG